jgi:hypothetical protein
MFDKLGKGRKECPSCHTIVGARSLKCFNCEFLFIKKEIESVTITETPELRKRFKDYSGDLVSIPSGKCPFVLDSLDKDKVELWCFKVFNNGVKNNKTYTNNALKYWSRVFVDSAFVRGFIDDWSAESGYTESFEDKPRIEETTRWENETFELLD